MLRRRQTVLDLSGDVQRAPLQGSQAVSSATDNCRTSARSSAVPCDLPTGAQSDVGA